MVNNAMRSPGIAVDDIELLVGSAGIKQLLEQFDVQRAKFSDL
jgi:hypothetical protein